MESTERDDQIRQENLAAYQHEVIRSASILQNNRHSTAEPYVWFGPNPEPGPPGPGCACHGCECRFILGLM